MASSNPLGHNDSFRRTWDKDEYARKARERIVKERDEGKKKNDEEPVQRELLKARAEKVDLDTQLGKTVVVTKTTPSHQGPGYYCEVCDCIVKDSLNYLDHINGRKHQRNLGMSMKVEKSSLDQVKKRFEHNKKLKEQKQKEYDYEKRVKELQAEEAAFQEQRREKKKERKRQARGETKEDDDDLDSGLDPELTSVMGFSGFGGAKRKC
jgi:U4/U6.U5 tri-snRNP component SNU23